MLRGIFDQNINMGKWEIILRACPIQIFVVYAHSYLAVLFWHENDIGNTLRIRGDGQESSVELFHDFGFNLL